VANPKNKPSSPKSPSMGGIKLFPNARFMVGFTTVLPQFCLIVSQWDHQVRESKKARTTEEVQLDWRDEVMTENKKVAWM